MRALLLLVTLAACGGGGDGGGLGSMPRCSAWIILHGAADLRLDCPQQQPAKPVPPPLAKPVRN